MRKCFFLVLLFNVVFCRKEMVSERMQQDMTVTAKSGLRLRKQPGLKAEKLMLLPKGTVVKVLESLKKEEIIGGAKGRWVKVVFGKNDKEMVEGWAFNAFLEKSRADIIMLNTGVSQFKGGCIRLEADDARCESCDSFLFSASGKFQARYGCDSTIKGTWSVEKSKLVAKGTFETSCSHFISANEGDPAKLKDECNKFEKSHKSTMKLYFRYSDKTWQKSTDLKKWSLAGNLFGFDTNQRQDP